MSHVTFIRFAAALALATCVACAHASLVTYHAIASSLDNGVTPPGTPIVLQFTIDDATPPSFLGTDHSEYPGAVTDGFLRMGGFTFPLLPSGVSLWNDSGPPGGVLLDQFYLLAFLSPGAPVPGLGQADMVVLAMNTLAPAPTPPLTSLLLDTPIPPGSDFLLSAEIQVSFSDGFLVGMITEGPLQGPAPAAEPSMAAALVASFAAFALARRRINARAAPRTPVQAA